MSNSGQSKPYQIKLATTDGLDTPVMHDRVHGVALGVLMRLDQ